MTGLYYDLGRMTRILMDFDPIEAGSFLEMLKDYVGEVEDYEGYKKPETVEDY